MPKLTKQEKHKKREANRAKLHAKQQKPKHKPERNYGDELLTYYQKGRAFPHSVNEDGIHTVHLGLFKTR
jgi:hypothetical protein